jgi:hypothetical protein
VRLIRETDNAPLQPGRWPNLNTAEHDENSQMLQRAIIGYALSHPIESIAHAARRVLTLMGGPTSIYDHKPSHRELALYRPLVAALALLLLAGYAVAAGRRALRLLGEPDNILVVTAFLSLLILAVGDAQEEARFLISVLPFLAAVPLTRPLEPGWPSLSNPGAAATSLAGWIRRRVASDGTRAQRRRRER